MRFHTIAGLVFAGGVLLACRDTAPTEQTVVEKGPVAIGSACSWSPSGLVGITEGISQTFFPDATPCDTHVVTITSGTAPFGFTQGSGCSLKQVSTSFTFKIRACDEGTATVTITLDGVPVQTISLESPA